MASGSSATIAYGTYTVGGAGAAAALDGAPSLTVDSETTALSFRAFIVGASLAATQAAGAALVTAFRQRRKNLVWSDPGGTVLSLSFDDNTAFQPVPDVTLVENYGKTRVYDVRIRWGMPADYSSLDGRRTTTISIDYLTSRRRLLKISGVWTAIDSDDARAKYEGDITTYAASIIADLGGNYNLSDEHVDYHEVNQELNFVQTYIQRLIANADSSVKDQTLSITVQQEEPGDANTIQDETPVRLETWTVNYTADIDIDTQTGTSALHALWTGTLLPWIVNQVESLISGAAALIDQQANEDATGNKISATAVFKVLTQDGPIEWSLVEELIIDDGYQTRPLNTGQPLDKLVYNGPATASKTIRENGTYAGSRPTGPTVGEVLARFGVTGTVEIRGKPITVGWLPQPHKEVIEEANMGLPDYADFQTWQIQREFSFEAFTEPILTGIRRTLAGV